MSCVFCQIVAKQLSSQIVYEDDTSLAFLDKNPQTPGHLQLIPKDHFRWIYETPEAGQLFATACWICRVIIPVLGADHATLATYGHGIKHAHIWIVPQYKREIFGEWNKSSRSKVEHDILEDKMRLALRKRSL